MERVCQEKIELFFMDAAYFILLSFLVDHWYCRLPRLQSLAAMTTLALNGEPTLYLERVRRVRTTVSSFSA